MFQFFKNGYLKVRETKKRAMKKCQEDELKYVTTTHYDYASTAYYEYYDYTYNGTHTTVTQRVKRSFSRVYGVDYKKLLICLIFLYCNYLLIFNLSGLHTIGVQNFDSVIWTSWKCLGLFSCCCVKNMKLQNINLSTRFNIVTVKINLIFLMLC